MFVTRVGREHGLNLAYTEDGCGGMSCELNTVCLSAMCGIGAIISGENLTHFGANINFWTVAEVVAEIRDSRSRSRLQSFPFKLQLRNVSEEALAFGKST